MYGGDCFEADSTGTCLEIYIYGCLDSLACNFAEDAIDDGSCDYSCLGCMDELACNYDSTATIDSGMCELPGDACDDMDDTTTNDAIDENCDCVGETIVKDAQKKERATTTRKRTWTTVLVNTSRVQAAPIRQLATTMIQQPSTTVRVCWLETPVTTVTMQQRMTQLMRLRLCQRTCGWHCGSVDAFVWHVPEPNNR